MSAVRQRLRTRHRRTGASLLGVIVLCAGLANAAPVAAGAGVPVASAPVASRPVAPDGPTPAAAGQPNVAFTDDTDHLVTLPARESNPHDTGFDDGDVHEGEASDSLGSQAFVSTEDNPNGEVYISFADETGAGLTPISITCDNFTKTHPVVSPDGQEIAYATNASGRFQIEIATLPEIGIDRVQPAVADCSGISYQTLPGQSGDNLWPTWVDDNTLIYSSTRGNALGDLYEQALGTGTTATRLTNGVQSNGDLVGNTQPAYDASHGAVYLTTTQFRSDGSIGYFPLNTTPLPTTPINAWLNTTPPPQSSEVDPGWFCVPSGTSEQCLHGVAYTSTDNDPYGGVYFTEFEASVDSIDPSSIRTVADTPGVSESHPALMNTGSTPQSEGIIFTQRSIGAQISSVAADGTGRAALIPTAGRDEFDTSKPAYSPDGTRIAYSRALVSSADVEGGSIPTRQIFITNTDGSGTPTPIGPFEDGTTSSGQFDIDTAPAWSPDGTKLAFSRTVAQFSSDESAHSISQEIWVVNVADPNNAAPLAVPGQGNFFDSAPSWSPDGRHIVISRVPDSTDLSLDMSSFPDPVRPGQTVTVRGFIANDAPGTANGLVLTFDFPDGLTPTTLPSDCAFGTSGQQVVCNQATLAAGDFADFDVQAIGSLPPGLGSVQYGVRGEVTSTTPEIDDSDNVDTAIVTVADSSDLSVSIDMQSESGSGTLADNTVTAHNSGPDTALNVVVTTTFSDTPAAYGTLSPGCSASGATVTCTLSSLAPGASQTFGIQASWTANCHGNGETVTGTSTIRSDSTDSDTSDNTRSDSIFIDPGVCLAAQPAPRPDRASRAHRSVQPSVAATQAIAITNHEGVRGLTLDTPPGPPELWVVSATDGSGAVLPPPTPCGADCAIGGIEPAWSPDGLHIAYESGGQIDVATLSDTTGASTTSIAPLTGYATYAAGTGGTPTPAYLQLATAHDPTWWPDGSKLVFTGQPAGQPDNVGIYLINANGSGLQTITQEPGPESEPSVQTFADLAVAVNPPTQTIFTAQTANIDATVTNNGPGRAASPTLTLTLPSGLTLDAASPNCTQPPVTSPTTITCTFATLASGDSATATISVESDTAGTYTVPGAVSSATPDGNTGNNTASAVVVVRPRADISTAITGYSDSTRTTATHEFKTGDPMFFRASITNGGAGVAVTNTFRITIPSGVHDPTALDASCTFTPTGAPGSDSGGVIACTVPSPLAPGSSVSFDFDDSSSVSGGYTFAADGTTSTPETDTTNNHSEWDVRVLNHAGITLTMVATSPVALGDSSDLTATVSNAGPDTAFGVTLTITIPTGMDPPTTVPTGCTIAASTMTCLLGDIAIGDSVTVTFTSQSTALGSHDFDGTATTDNDVPSSSSDKATVVVIPRKADLSVTITLSQTTAQPGDSLTATIKVHNAGPQEAVNTTLTTAFDSRLDATAVPSCAAGGTCSLGTLNPGDDVTFIVNLHPQESGTPPNNYTVSMSAQVTSDTLDPNTANNKAIATLPVIQQLTDVAVAVNVAPVAYVGGTTSAKITVVNHGPAAASDVRLSVTMPVQLAASATPACVTGTSVCNLGTFASGAHRTFTISLIPHRLHHPRSYAVTIAAKLTTISIESTLANDQDSAKLSVKQPRLRLLPPIGPPGFVTLAFGENLPPGAIVTLRWREGITTFDGPYRVAADGTVEAPMLVVRRDELGPRQAVLRGKPGRFAPVRANMLVVPNTEQPPRFLGRG